MPHLTEALSNFRNCKKFTNHRFHHPLRQVLPPVLNDRVSGKADNQKVVACLQEMSVMLNCFKEYEFDQSRCSKEVEAFNKCYTASQVASAKLKAAEARGMVPGEKRLSSKHMNVLFKRYPQPK